MRRLCGKDRAARDHSNLFLSLSFCLSMQSIDQVSAWMRLRRGLDNKGKSGDSNLWGGSVNVQNQINVETNKYLSRVFRVHCAIPGIYNSMQKKALKGRILSISESLILNYPLASINLLIPSAIPSGLGLSAQTSASNPNVSLK